MPDTPLPSPKVHENRLPLPGEKCAVTSNHLFKQAALLFDKIWVPNPHDENFKAPTEVTYSIPKCDDEIYRWFTMRLTPELIRKLHKIAPTQQSVYNNVSRQKILKELLKALSSYSHRVAQIQTKHGFNVIPLYPSESEFEAVFPKGEIIAYRALLNNIEVVSEQHIVWEQVLEFRKDKEAKWKYRALRTWLADSFKAESVSEATDIIGKKLDDYEWALRKHGLRTISGALSDILESKSLAAIAAGTGVAGFIGGPIWLAIAGGTLALGKFAVSLSERLIDLEDIKRGTNAEVALIYEARRKFRKSRIP